MAPVVAEAAVVVMMAVLLSTPLAVAMDGKGKGSSLPRLQQQERRPVAAGVLAWGQRRLNNSNQVKLDPKHPLGTRSPEGSEEKYESYPDDQVVDASWTHAAFRAFHEMRAGRPLSAEIEEVAEEDDHAGPLGGVVRLATRLSRYDFY